MALLMDVYRYPGRFVVRYTPSRKVLDGTDRRTQHLEGRKPRNVVTPTGEPATGVEDVLRIRCQGQSIVASVVRRGDDLLLVVAGLRHDLLRLLPSGGIGTVVSGPLDSWIVPDGVELAGPTLLVIDEIVLPCGRHRREGHVVSAAKLAETTDRLGTGGKKPRNVDVARVSR